MAQDSRALSGQWLGDYQLLDLLNTGGMAEVYRARESSTNRLVAVKVLPPALAADPAYVTRFKNEAIQVRKLAHPNIVRIEDFGQQGQYFYLVMPLFPGSLRDVLNRHALLHPLDVLAVGMQIASALAAVHALGLIHRDIKPDNILLSDDRAMLTDFGIVRRIDIAQEGQIPTLAGTGLPVGTPQYMAPEQLAGHTVDHRADLYALGAVLYEMLTGRPPHIGEGPYAVASHALNDPIMPPSRLNPVISPGFDAVLMRALARDPGDRYANAASMQDALKRIEVQVRHTTATTSKHPRLSEVTAALPRPSLPQAPTAERPQRGAPEVSPPPTVVSDDIPTVMLPAGPDVPTRASGSQNYSGNRGGGHGGDGGNGGNGGGGEEPGNGDDERRRLPQPALLIALAAVVLLVSVFCGVSLAMKGFARGDNAAATSTRSYDPTYEAMAATATILAQTPTVTTGPGTPTPTPRPPLPTRTPTPRPPTVTTGPGTPTPTPYPTDTPAPTPTATDTPTPTETPTDIPTETPTEVPTP